MKTLSLLEIIGRNSPLFKEDLRAHEAELSDQIANSRFLVVGGAGSIGGAVVHELFARNPQVLHVIDTSENNLAELVRDIRSSLGYIEGDFHAFCFDALGSEFNAFAKQALGQGKPYDYVLNFSAAQACPQ